MKAKAKRGRPLAFKTLVRRWRLRHKLGQRDAASLLGVPRRTFQDWEYGRRTPLGLARDLIVQKLTEADGP